MCTILLGADSSARSQDAAALARRLAQAGSAEVIVAVVTAADFPERDQATAVATRLRDLLGLPRVDVRVLAADSPARGLHELAEQAAATVTVVGSTHTGHLGRVRPGSTGERLLCGSPCAVALAPSGYRSRSGERIARVGVAYDGSPESCGALVAAQAAARAFDAALDVITVVSDSASALLTDAGYDLTHRAIEAEIRRDLDELIAELPGAAGIVLEGRPWQVLADYSAQLDLLFAGSRGYGPLHAVMAGGTSGPLMQHAHCPVIVLPRGADTAFADLFEPEAGLRVSRSASATFSGRREPRWAMQ